MALEWFDYSDTERYRPEDGYVQPDNATILSGAHSRVVPTVIYGIIDHDDSLYLVPLINGAAIGKVEIPTVDAGKAEAERLDGEVGTFAGLL